MARVKERVVIMGFSKCNKRKSEYDGEHTYGVIEWKEDVITTIRFNFSNEDGQYLGGRMTFDTLEECVEVLTAMRDEIAKSWQHPS